MRQAAIVLQLTVNADEKEDGMSQAGALSGIRVVDLSRLLPGPYCSMILADHGAEVIAVEDRKFMDDGLFFREIYRNKRHISLNLKTSEGLEIFSKLARDADVILEGFRPGVVKRLGVDYESVQKINPGVIYCAITGYGQTGPMRDRVGHDVNYLSTTGILDLIGEKDRPPAIPGVQIADIAGGMNAVIGILLALLARGQSGRGQYIDIAMTDSLLGFMTLPLLLTQLSGKKFTRSENMLSHRYACYSTYETADYKYLAIGAVEKRFWRNLCAHLGLPEYIELQYDEDRREEITTRLRTIFKGKPLADWDMELSGIEVCHAAIRNIDEVVRDPFFLERGMVVEHLREGGGTIKTFGIPVKLSETPGAFRTHPAGFGENTRDILKELGYGEEQIDAFYADGVV
jgi:crotonobetainyl-CoA:carnitine CoA-transferase CaiB-like acyl-CoA transferase